MYFSSSASSHLFKLLLLCGVAFLLCCGLVDRVMASCGDYLQHSPVGGSSSMADQPQQPVEPFTPGCRGIQCNRQPMATPVDSAGNRSVVRQVLGTFGLEFPEIDLQRFHSTLPCVCFYPLAMASDVLLRPPIG